MVITLIIGEEDKEILMIYLDNNKKSNLTIVFLLLKGENIMYICRNPTLIL